VHHKDIRVLFLGVQIKCLVCYEESVQRPGTTPSTEDGCTSPLFLVATIIFVCHSFCRKIGMAIAKGPKSGATLFFCCVSDADLLAAIDAMEFGARKADIWAKERGNAKLRR